MKKLYLIGGTMGVGKTTVCQFMKQKLNNSVFLDGDWCWDMHPFCITEETKAMVVDNICHLLNNFLHCTVYENIIFCWVMHQQSIIEAICSKLDLIDTVCFSVSLICTEARLRERLQKDIRAGIRSMDVIERSVARVPFYEKLDTIKIDVTNITAEQAAEKIMDL